MKYIYQLFIALFLSLGFVACGDEEFIEIDSLSADGDEFFCNQKVKLWMCVRSSDLWHTTYEWSCDAGTLTQPQGLNEMTWKSPSLPGTYTITCKATTGGVSEVRTHQMYVSSYYFDKFEKSPYSLSVQSESTSSLKTEVVNNVPNQYLQVKANSTKEVTRYIRRSFDDAGLYTPFSVRLFWGFESNVPTTRITKVGTKTSNSMLEYRWNMRSDASNNSAYVSQIRLLWYPANVKDGYPTLTAPLMTVEGTADYNVQLIVQHTAANGVKTTYNEYRKLNTMNVFQAKQYKNVSMSVDENEELLVFVDGTSALTSSIVKNVRVEKACEGRMSVNNWEIYYLNGDGGKNIPVMYLDNAYASTTEILK